jgi:hypothetical protein
MQFLTVSAINTQFPVNAGGSADVGGIGQGAAGQVGGSIGYSDSPTITYVPQSEAGFYKSLYTPFEIQETIGFGISYRYARMDSVWQRLSLRFSFASINRADDFIGGRQVDLYIARTDAIARLLEAGDDAPQVVIPVGGGQSCRQESANAT